MTAIPDWPAFYHITRRVYEYAYGIDSRDWELYRSIFTDKIHMDFSSYSGNPAAEVSADNWVSGVKVLFTGLQATQHQMSNPLVDVDGHQARCRMYMQAEHFYVTDRGQESYTLGGYYDNKLVDGAEGWKICAVTLNMNWQTGNRQIMAQARAAGAALLEQADGMERPDNG